MKTGKSLTSQYYKMSKATLAQPLTMALNTISKENKASKEFLLAYITVILKSNKDPSECTNYSPIFLLNLDLKLLAKILANRIRPFLERLIGPEQVGFMPGRKAKDNTIKTLNLIHRIWQSGVKGLLLSTDEEKAFNQVSWDYMFSTCEHIGFGNNMMTWVKIPLYQPERKNKNEWYLFRNSRNP